MEARGIEYMVMKHRRYTYMRMPGTDRDIARNFLLIQNALDDLASASSADSILLEDLDLEVAYINEVPHGLGRLVVGWRVVKSSAPAMICENEATSDTTYLHLLVSGDVTVDLEVW